MPRRPMRDLREFVDHLGDVGLKPATVIDVGACYGTPELLQGAPDAYHVLVEPLPALEGRLRQILSRFKGEYHMLALGDTPGRSTMYVPPGGAEGATLLASAKNLTPVEITVETMDRLFDPRPYETPILVKTDCQGYDLAVMRGGRSFLRKVDALVMEVNLFHPRNDAANPDFGDIVLAMREMGFAVYDILSYQVRPRDNALGYVDVAFAREDGPLRKHHAWA